MTTLNASKSTPPPSPPSPPSKAQPVYNYIGAYGPVVLQYNTSKGGAVQYKNPNQTKATSAQMNSPND